MPSLDTNLIVRVRRESQIPSSGVAYNVNLEEMFTCTSTPHDDVQIYAKERKLPRVGHVRVAQAVSNACTAFKKPFPVRVAGFNYTLPLLCTPGLVTAFESGSRQGPGCNCLEVIPSGTGFVALARIVGHEIHSGDIKYSSI